MRVTKQFSKQNAVKAKISAMLNRHCCHGNSGDVTFMTNFQMFDSCCMYGEQVTISRKHQSLPRVDLISSF